MLALHNNYLCMYSRRLPQLSSQGLERAPYILGYPTTSWATQKLIHFLTEELSMLLVNLMPQLTWSFNSLTESKHCSLSLLWASRRPQYK